MSLIEIIELACLAALMIAVIRFRSYSITIIDLLLLLLLQQHMYNLLANNVIFRLKKYVCREQSEISIMM